MTITLLDDELDEEEKLLKDDDELLQEEDELLSDEDELTDEDDELLNDEDELLSEDDELLDEEEKLLSDEDELTDEDELLNDDEELCREGDELDDIKEELLLVCAEKLLELELVELDTELELLINAKLLDDELRLEDELNTLLELNDGILEALELVATEDREFDNSLLELELLLVELSLLELSLLEIATLELLETSSLLRLLDEEGTIIIVELELSLELRRVILLLELLTGKLATLLEPGASLEIDVERLDKLEELLNVGNSPVGTLDRLELLAGGLSLPPPPPQAPSDKAIISAQPARKDKPWINFIGNL